MRRRAVPLMALLLAGAACTHPLKVAPNELAGHVVTRVHLKEGAYVYYDRVGARLVGDSLVGMSDDRDYPKRIAIAVSDVAEAERDEIGNAAGGGLIFGFIVVAGTIAIATAIAGNLGRIH